MVRIFSPVLCQPNVISDVVILTVTRFSEENTESVVGYKSFNFARSEFLGGCVYLFFKNNLDCCITEINNVSSESFEFFHMKLQAPRSKIINTIPVYRPPCHNPLTQFTSEIEDLLKVFRNGGYLK